MKKIIAVLLLSVLLLTSLVGCFKKDYGYDHYNYDLNEYITVGDYKDIEINIYTLTRDKDKQELIDYYTEYYATAKEDVVPVDGDTVSVDIVCTIDGVENETETKTGVYIELGANTLPEEVNAAIIGMAADETKSVVAAFSDDYTNKDVAGKTATFDITLNHVMVDAEYNDEFVATYFADYNVATVKEFDDYLNHNFLLSNILKAIMAQDAYKVLAYPEDELNELIEAQCEYEESMYMSYYGLSLEEYLTMIDEPMTLKEYKESLKTNENLLESIENEMLYHFIARAEGFQVTDAEGEALRTQMINDSMVYYQKIYTEMGYTGATLENYMANALASLQQTYTLEDCKQSLLYEQVEELLMNGQNVNYLEEFDPTAEEESSSDAE